MWRGDFCEAGEELAVAAFSRWVQDDDVRCAIEFGEIKVFCPADMEFGVIDIVVNGVSTGIFYGFGMALDADETGCGIRQM